jgi:hypothetical protein
MNREQLIHLHSLGEEVADGFDMETPTHDEIGVSSIEVHKNNSEHEEAMFAIFEDIRKNIEEERAKEEL